MHSIGYRTGSAWAGLALLALAATVGNAAADSAPTSANQAAAAPPAAAQTPIQTPATTDSETPVKETGHLAHRLLKDIESGVARVEPWLERYGYWAVFGAVGVEGFGIPAPGQTVLEAGAAASATAGSRLQIGWILLVAFLGASLGNTIGYLIGRLGGLALLHRLRIDKSHLDKVQKGFDRYGGWLIAFARFFDGPRQLNGIAAGILEMPWLHFTLYNLLGAALWVCFWGLGVYYLDLHLDAIVSLIRQVNPWVWGITLAGLAVLAIFLWRTYSRRDKRVR
jgi:membrane protein DedA with SNARE-associated domain